LVATVMQLRIQENCECQTIPVYAQLRVRATRCAGKARLPSGEGAASIIIATAMKKASLQKTLALIGACGCNPASHRQHQHILQFGTQELPAVPQSATGQLAPAHKPATEAAATASAAVSAAQSKFGIQQGALLPCTHSPKVT